MVTNDEKRQELEREFYQTQNKIADLQKEIEREENEQIKRKKKMKLKLLVRKLLILSPCLGAYAGIFVGFVKLGAAPFLSHKEELRRKIDIADKNKVTYEYQYKDFSNAKNTLNYHSNLINENGKYFYENKTYDVTKVSENTINKIINKDYTSLEDLFGKPMHISKVGVDNPTESDFNAKPYVTGTFYDKDKNDYIVIKPNRMDNLESILLYILSCTIATVPFLPFYFGPISDSYYHYEARLEKEYIKHEREIETKKLTLKK